MLFKKNRTEKLDLDLFANPSSEYRSTPFWGWNGDLQKEELLRQIEIFKEMGMGGFHMHARAGLVTPYLSDEFMQRVKDCCEKAEKEGLLAWLYDEDRYPSGPAGGIVTQNPDYTRRYLRFTAYEYGKEGAAQFSQGSYPRKSDGELIARYDIGLGEDNFLRSYKRLKDGETGENIWYVYFEKQDATVPGNQTYVDAMNPLAIEEFARVTYDRYKEVVGEYFGNVSPAMFTDEPQYASETILSFAGEKEDVILPWTDTFPRTYKETYGSDVLDFLPEIIWNLPEGKLSQPRYFYHDHVAERFVSAFCDTLGNWCDENGIMFTGHVMSEGSLEGQTMRSGEAMRSYRAFHMPGIDVLGLHKLEYPTAKQAQSAVRQQGSEAMMSELYGVSGWDFDFRGFKLQGDWQAAMGVTVRVPHHSWYTMKGEGKRDYPGSINYHAPWWKENRLLEDHFARLNTALTRGKPNVRVGVIHPIDSYWLHFGPGDQSGAAAQIEKNFNDLINALVKGLIDFDFISEARLPALCEKGGNPLEVGEMGYDIVIIPALETLRKTTLERLYAFREKGGRLIFLGDCPRYLDAKRSEETAELYGRSEKMGFEAAALVERLKDVRFLEARLPGGNRAGHLTYQLRDDGRDKWLFIATTRSQPSPDADIPNQGIKFNVGQEYDAQTLRFELEGEYKLELFDTLTGDINALPARYSNGKTLFSRKWHMHDSLLLRLAPGKNQSEEKTAAKLPEPRRIFGKVGVALDEPNVLLLDMAEYSLDGEAFRPMEEILRLENICRERCGIYMRKRAIPQPYQMERQEAKHVVRLRFAIPSRVRVKAPQLALEDADTTRLWLNGSEVDMTVSGWYVDRAIKRVNLPPIEEGMNILELEKPFGADDPLEYCYLLGDFGVKVEGTKKTVTAPVRQLNFGNWVHQSLPFYSGNLTYHLKISTNGGIILRIPHYRGALMRVFVDGKDRGPVAFSPYALDLSDLKAGEHSIDIKLYGTRNNTFGPLHHLSSIPFSQGPDGWRSTGDLWNYEYSFAQKGVMSSPRIYDLQQALHSGDAGD